MNGERKQHRFGGVSMKSILLITAILLTLFATRSQSRADELA